MLTPFDQWWARVSSHFCNVPEDVARQWLHRHWSHSPFGFMSSELYSFARERWPSARLGTVLSVANEWNYQETLRRGQHLYDHSESWLACHMKKHRTFPAPIIVLDNRQGEIRTDPNTPSARDYPNAYILIEGHKRFEWAAILMKLSLFKTQADIWLARLKKV